MYQIERSIIEKDAAGVQTGIRVLFTSGQEIVVPFSDIPATATTLEAKAAWLTDRLNELLVVGTWPDGRPIRHYKANVVGLSDNPLTVAFSLEAV